MMSEEERKQAEKEWWHITAVMIAIFAIIALAAVIIDHIR
jgi:hypothetical protein